MNVWRASEVPCERRTFDAPDVPNLVFVQIAFAVERHAKLVETTALFQDRHRFVHIFAAVGRQDHTQRFFHQFLLVVAQIANANPGELSALSLKQHIGLLGRFVNERHFCLRSIQGAEYLVGLLCLVMEQIVFGVFFGMAVDQRAAKGAIRHAVPVCPECQMASRQFPLKVAAARLTKDGTTVSIDAGRVVLHLFQQSLVTIFGRHFADDFQHVGSLLFRKDFADGRLDDVPVGADLVAELMIEWQTDHFSLGIGERLVKTADSRFRRTAIGRRPTGDMCKAWHGAKGQGRAAKLLDETPAVFTPGRLFAIGARFVVVRWHSVCLRGINDGCTDRGARTSMGGPPVLAISIR